MSEHVVGEHDPERITVSTDAHIVSRKDTTMTSYSTNPGHSWWSEPRRAWYYRIALAVIPILVAVGVLADNVAPLVISLVAAIFSTGMATVNTTTKPID